MKKQSSYKPRPVILDTMGWILSGFKPLVSVGDENVKLRLRNHMAFDAIASGTANVSDLDMLIAASNMATALARKHGADWREEIRASADAIEAMQKRYKKWRKVQATPAEIEAVSLMLRVHDAQLDASRIGDLEEAIQIAKRKAATA